MKKLLFLLFLVTTFSFAHYAFNYKNVYNPGNGYCYIVNTFNSSGYIGIPGYGSAYDGYLEYNHQIVDFFDENDVGSNGNIWYEEWYTKQVSCD